MKSEVGWSNSFVTKHSGGKGAFTNDIRRVFTYLKFSPLRCDLNTNNFGLFLVIESAAGAKKTLCGPV